jgi:hypothetical protein
MERAREMGFTISAYHGTTEKFNEFDFGRGKSGMVSGFAPHFTDQRGEAKGYADARGEERNTKGRVLSVLLRIKKPYYVGDLYHNLSREEYTLVSGGIEPSDPTKLSFHDARREIDTKLYHKAKALDINAPWPHRESWTHTYNMLRKEGYDALIWEDVPADYQRYKYRKITMLDMSGIRLISATFDPSKANEKNLKA